MGDAMKDELIYSVWYADVSSYRDRIAQTLAAVERTFRETTFWDSVPQLTPSPNMHFSAKTEETIRKGGGSLSGLWRSATAHFAAISIPEEQIVVEATAYSEALNLGVRIFADDWQVKLETAPEDVSHAFSTHLDALLALLRDIAASPAMAGCWLRHHAAFAGDPVHLYEPKKIFSKFYDALDYEEVIDDVRAVREEVRAKLSKDDLVALLTEIGVEVAPLGKRKIFARLGDPRRQGGKKVLDEFEKRVTARLREKR